MASILFPFRQWCALFFSFFSCSLNPIQTLIYFRFNNILPDQKHIVRLSAAITRLYWCAQFMLNIYRFVGEKKIVCKRMSIWGWQPDLSWNSINDSSYIYRKILIFNVIRLENVQNVKYGGGLKEIEMWITYVCDVEGSLANFTLDGVYLRVL